MRTNFVQKIGIYFLLALPGLVIFSPLLFGGQAFADSDTVLQQYTSMDFLSQSQEARDSLDWNPHVLTGFIPVVGLMGGLLSWLHQLIYQYFSVFSGFAWITFLNFTLTAIFIYELIKKLGLSQAAAIFAALVLPWTTAYFVWSGNMTVSSGNVLLPALLYFFLYFAKSRALGKNIIIALAAGALTGTIMLAAHFQWSLQAIFVAMIWALFLDWQNLKNKNGLFKFQTTAFALVTLIVAGIFFWPQFQVSLFAQEFSSRASGVSFADAQSGALLPGDVLSLIFPSLSLPKGVSQPGLFYLGALPLFFLIFSILVPNRSPYYKFFVWLALLTVLVSIKFSPLLWLANKMPLFNSFRSLSRFTYVGIFSAVILATYGFQGLLGRWEDFKSKKLPKLLWVASLIGLGVFVFWSILFPRVEKFAFERTRNFFDARYDTVQFTLPREHYHQVVGQLIRKIGEGTSFPNLPITVSVLSLVAGAGIICHYQKNGQAPRFIILSLAVAGLNLLLVNVSLLRLVSAEQIRATPPPVIYLKNIDQTDFRVFTFLSGFTTFERLDTPFGYEPVENVELQKNILRANLNMFYGIDNLDYYDNLMDRRSSRILAYLGSDRSLSQSGKLAEDEVSFDEKKRLFLERLPLLSQYNVKYIISAYPLEHSDLKEVLRWQATTHNIPLYLYQNLKARPRYYLTSDIEFSEPLSEEDSWQKNLSAAAKPRILIECEVCPPVATTGKSEWKLVKSNNAEYAFEIQTSSPQWFVFGQNFLPGWQATIDDERAQIYRANFVNQAILVPEGLHQINFRYSL